MRANRTFPDCSSREVVNIFGRPFHICRAIRVELKTFCLREPQIIAETQRDIPYSENAIRCGKQLWSTDLMPDLLAVPAPLSRDAWSKASQQYHRHAMATPMPLQLVGTDAPVGVLCSGCSRLVDLTHDVAACWLDAFRVDTLQRLRRWLHGS